MKLIAFVGCDGSGKSSQVRRVARQLKRQFRTTVIDKWDILDEQLHPECRFLHRDLEPLRVCIAEMEGPGRALFLAWSILNTTTRAQAGGSEIGLLDGYWMKHAAAEIEYGTDARWIEHVVSVFPRADAVLFFDVDPEVSLARKRDLTPYECGRDTSCSPQAFLAHQTAVSRRMRAWATEHGWVHVDANQKQDVVSERVDSILDGLMR